MTQPLKSAVAEALMPLPTITEIFDAMRARFDLKPRKSQFGLAEHVRNAVASDGVCCIEAPTGTGKTLGYLAGALDAQAHAGNPVPIVIATATVGLQEQILRDDIPRLAEVGAVDPRKVAVAKGRGRYFCPRTASMLEDKKMQDTQSDMFHTEKHVAEGGVPIALDMLKAWRNKEWDGDRDSWEGAIPGCWTASCGASSDTCVQKACEYFHDCPYMASRAKLATAQLIIANHDMVLADLAQRAEEMSSTALPPKRYAVIFDEAHNLPKKAVATKQAVAALNNVDWLRKLEPYGEATLNVPRVAKALDRATDCRRDVFSVGAADLLHAMEALAADLAKSLSFGLNGSCNWGLKAPSEALYLKVVSVASQAVELVAALKVTAKAYADYAEEITGAEKSFAVRMLTQTHQFYRHAKDLQQGLELFCSRDPLVRWATRSRDGKVALHTQPMEGAEVLKELLWRTGFSVSMVSATLQIAGSFKRFSDKVGLPGHAVTAALPAVFDYSRGYLHCPEMDCSPGDAGFETEITQKLERLFNQSPAKGMLVLFTSRESMRRVVRALPESVGSHTLVQDHRALPELVAAHKDRINKGQRSMLIGLDSMAEGLDLPGRYCSHVVITRLPFAVPGDPVEEARREYLGTAWFEEAYLADMLTMLIQAAGRLIRRENDHGVITVLDKRLITKRYCKTAIAALPAFERGPKLARYLALAKERGFDMEFSTAAGPKLSLVPSVAVDPDAVMDAAIEMALAAPASSSPVAELLMAPTKKLSAAAQCEQLADPLYPSDTLRRLTSAPAPTEAPVVTSVELLDRAMETLMPHAKGPFTEHEDGYLHDWGEPPCLSVGSPTYLWAERAMPQAVMLGLRMRNLPWDRTAPAWLQVLRVRPDLLQYAQILRSHRTGQLDPRCQMIPAAECEQQLTRGFAHLQYAGEDRLFQALSELEAEVVAVLGEPHVKPRKELLSEFAQAAQDLVRALRHELVPF